LTPIRSASNFDPAISPKTISESTISEKHGGGQHSTPIHNRANRRVLRGQAVAANEKIVSPFEQHADIIVKGGREVQYGHKLNLTTGRSGLILDLVIEAGNPADSERFLPMLKRHIAFYGEAPRQSAADGVSPAVTISPRRRPLASTTWPSTRRPACASRTWSRAIGVIAHWRNATGAPSTAF